MLDGNFKLMQKHFKRPFKCVVLLRNLMDVLASYMQWYTENLDAFPNRLKSISNQRFEGSGVCANDF